MTLQITANPKRQSAFGITANTRRAASVGSKVNWDSLFDLPAAIEFFAENDVGANEYPHGDASGNWQYSTVSPFSRTVLDDTTANAWLTTITATRAETGAVAVPVLDKVREVVSAADFGFSTSATATVNAAALQAAVDTGKEVFIPPGTYTINATINVSTTKTRIRGAGQDTVTIYQTTLSAKIFNVTADNVTISDLSLDYDGTPTAGGTAIYSSGSTCQFFNFKINRAYIGVHLNDNIQSIHHVHIYNYVSIGIWVQAAGDVFIDSFLLNAVSTTNGDLGGIRLSDFAEAIIVTNGDILTGKYSLTTSASVYAAGSRPAYNRFSNVYFDSATNGCFVDNAVSIKFIGCWFSNGRSGSGNPGITLDTVEGLSFVGCQFNNCGSNGAYVSAEATNVTFDACHFYGNSVTAGDNVAAALEFQANTAKFRVTNCIFTNALFVGVQKYGVLINTGCSSYIVTGNHVAGNGTAGISDLAASSTKVVGLNIDSSVSALPAIAGGTGQISYTIGDILYASSASALSALAGVATGNSLISGGVGTAPSWGKIGLTTHVSGILPGANGGTGNGFFAVSGPATSLKTFTYPNASDTVACLGQAQTFTAAQAIQLTTAGTVQTLTSTEAGAGSGPNLLLDRNSASPASLDSLARVIFRGRDSGGNATDYGIITTTLLDATDGSEDAEFALYAMVAGSAVNGLSVGNGVNVGGGTYQGAGTLNAATALYVANTKVVGARDTGWAAMTGTANENTVYDTASVTLAQLAGRVMALQAALTTHGLIGT